MPHSEETRLPPSAGRYLIAHRRNAAARGLRPMSAGDMQNAVKSLPGIEVVKVIKPKRRLAAMSAAGAEGTETFVVRMDEQRAEFVKQTVPPNLIMERDASLGITPPSPVKPSLSMAAAPAGIVQGTVKFKVIGEGDEPLENVTVSLTGIGFPIERTTDKNGFVAIDFITMPGQPPSTLFVHAAPNHWDMYLQVPNLDMNGVNVVRLKGFGETVSGFPDTFRFGWGTKAMGLDLLDARFTGAGVKIAIIDSGIDNSHPLLQHIQQGKDLTGDSDKWNEDVIGHGTHCAGTIAGRAAGPGGFRGFAPEAEVHIFKIFPGGHFSDLLEALDACIEREIDVVNMSLGSTEASEAVEQVLEECVERGMVCIAAAGNQGGAVQFPAASRNALAVAALGRLSEFPPDTWDARTAVPGQIANDGTFSPTFTNFGPEVDVCAPGVAIISTAPGGRFKSESGTSMAAPHVTGLTALLLAHHPAFRTQLRERNRDRVLGVAELLRAAALPMPFVGGRSGSGMPRTNILSAAAAEPASAGPGVRAAVGVAPQSAWPRFTPVGGFSGTPAALAPLFAWR
jgi:subtilisin